MSALLILLALFATSLLLTAAPLALTARLLAYPRRGIPRALLVVLALFLLNVLLALPQLLIPPELALPYACLALIFEIVAAWALVKTFFGTTPLRAWGGVGGMVVGQIAILAAVFGLVHPYLAEAYRIPNLAMAPTLLGEHRFVPCPHCGVLQPVETLSPFDNDPRLPLQETMYCPSCGTHWEATPQKVAGPIFSADRILVTRFLTPTRWDLVTYEHGKDIFVKRLVGLPGERISITRDGRLLINGTAALPPAGAPATFPWPEQLAGFPMALVPDHAMTLGPTDYFFIGDSAPASFDSRFDGPVHAAALRGVVSARYWPLSRVKLFR